MILLAPASTDLEICLCGDACAPVVSARRVCALAVMRRVVCVRLLSCVEGQGASSPVYMHMRRGSWRQVGDTLCGASCVCGLCVGHPTKHMCSLLVAAFRVYRAQLYLTENRL
eukprot:3517487-Prymnesium_polylepis.1